MFPFDGSLLLNTAAPLDQSWQDLDFMDTLWDLPSMGGESWLNEVDNLPALGIPERQPTPSFIEENVLHIDSAYDMMVEYFKRRSKSSSLSRSGPGSSWYSVAPRLQMYPSDAINVLLNLARSHISPTFVIFSNFEATNDTSRELCLAMAAVGALFSAAEGNVAVAKALYNDARRIHLERTLRVEPGSFEAMLDRAKTFILLEIYGLCSGDKRSYELWDAFHYGTLQASKSCSDEAPSELDFVYSERLSQLSEAVTVLESYRVLVLSRPPLFLPLQDSIAVTAERPSDGQSSMTADLLSLLTPSGKLHASCGNLRSLAILILYTWMSSPRGRELKRTLQLWKPEFVELALERWVNAKAEPSDLAQMLLYHLAHINLHVNLGMLQDFAHDFRHRNSVKNTGVLPRLETVRQFVIGAEFEVVHWHAKALLQVVKEAMATPFNRHQQSNCRSRLIEPPHQPYCIYFATLVLWYGAPDTSRSEVARDECIENGIQLLSKLTVQASRVLGGALGELLSTERREVDGPTG